MATDHRRRGETAYDGWLFETYTRYVTEPESKAEVYGYALMVVGYVLAMGGLLVYLLGPSGSNVDPSTLFLVREAAAVPAATGLTLSLAGIVLQLPVRRGSLAVSAIGALVALVAVALFVVYYPGNWYPATPSYSGLIIALYTVGTGLLAGVVLMVPVVTGERSYLAETAEGHEYEHPAIMIGDADRGGLFAIFKRGREWTWRYIDQSAVAGSTADFLSRLEAEERVETVKAQVADAGLLEINNAAFRLYEDAEGTWQWYLMREDGSAVAEADHEHDSRDEADAAINAIKDHGPSAALFVFDDPVFEPYRREGAWAWRLIDQERTPMAVSSTTTPARGDATATLDEVRTLADEAIHLVLEHYGVELVAEDGDGWGWELRDRTHRQLAESVGSYDSKGVAEEAVYDLLDRLQGASVLEAGQATYDVYHDGTQWAWRLVDHAGEPVAVGTATAESHDPVANAARRMQADAGSAEIVEIRDREFETYRTDEGWHWRLVDSDRQVHARSTDVYDSAAEASRVVDRVRTEAPEADLIEFENAAFQVYEAEGGAWRWRLIDEDGTVLADSGQGEYESKDDAMGAMTTLQENAPDAEHLEIESAAFELFEDDRGWGWRLVDDIGETIADGATRHDSEEGARKAMDDLIASVGDVMERQMDGGVFHVYPDADDQWWWQFVLPDGSVIAEGPDSYGTRHEVERAVADLKPEAAGAPVAVLGTLAVLLEPGDWSWELVDADREPVAESTVTYGSRGAATDAIEDLQSRAGDVTVYEIRDGAFEAYREDEGWAWRLVDADHDEVATSPTTYEDRETVTAAIETVSTTAPTADLVEYEDLAFEVYHAEGGWTWRLLDEDRRALASAASQAPDQAGAEAAVEDAREQIAEASVIEIDAASFEFHHTDEGWRWRLVDDRGTELAESVGRFETRAAAQEELSTVKEHGPDAWVSVAE